jgi:hypothetical protein
LPLPKSFDFWAALNSLLSSGLRPRVVTISPDFRKALETEIACSSTPPGLLRRS